MPDETTLSKAAQQIMAALYQLGGEEVRRSDLRDSTSFTDADVLAALSELQNRQWVEHTGYPGSPSGDTWRLTPLGQSAGSRTFADAALRKTLENTIILRPSRDRGLIWGLRIAGLLYAFLLVGLLVLGWKWVGIFLVFFVGVWVGLLFAFLLRCSEVAWLSPTTLTTRTWYGRLQTTPRESIERITLVSVHFGSSGRGSGTAHYLLFLNVQDHCLNWLRTNDIPMNAQKAFAQQFGVPLRDLSKEEVSRRHLEKAFPGTTAGRSTMMGLAILGAVILGLAITTLLILVG